jgi:hypothetical protein
MADEEEKEADDEKEVEFIDAKTDAEYRLECLHLAHQTIGCPSNAPAILDAAKAYYDWIMETEEPSAATATTEEPCTPRRH